MKYSALIMKHFENPRNAGALEHATAVGHATNEVCLDKMTIYLLVEDRVITAATFQAEGCVPSIAAGSMLTEILIGKSEQAAAGITAADVECALGGLPSTKKHAAHLAVEALASALAQQTH